MTMQKNKNLTARALALSLLRQAERHKQFSNIVLDKALESCTLEQSDRRLLTRLFYGVTERKITLDYRIAQLSSRPPSEIDADTLMLLRMGLYQLMYMDKIPAHAAINETVALCSRKASGFVNAILRSHMRKKDFPLPDEHTHGVELVSVSYSVCAELASKFINTFGMEKTKSILGALSSPPTTLRTNTLKYTREQLAAKIEGATPTPISKNGLFVSGSVRELLGYDEGAFFVQDEASQICTLALDAREGMTVADICACPGSKSFGAAIDMQNRGRVISFDLHENKLSLISSGARRLGIDIIEAHAHDGREYISELDGRCDRVLCDVPCSGFGVLAKKPELRYKNPSDSAALPDIQLSILSNACKYVAHGGVLVYSTCTVFPEENEQNIKRFLDTHPDFSLCPFEVGELCVPEGQITLLPDTHNTDGFFIAKLTRS